MAGLLEGKVALATGAARGIGLATATLLAEQGARLVVSDVDDAAKKDAALGREVFRKS